MAAEKTIEKQQGRILIVDDDPDLLALLHILLRRSGYLVEACASLEQMHGYIRASSFDCILLDLFLGEENTTSVLPILAREQPTIKIIIMTAHGSIEQAVTSMHLGATSFVSKSQDAQRIVAEVEMHLQTSIGQVSPLPLETFAELGLIGQSPEIQRLFAEILRFKDSEATVLVQGESGTGKELVARAIHALSIRQSELFAALNCAAIPENLLESELFGHKKGAFTDAKADRKGIFESCSLGTLFLDEIGDMPTNLQAKLLRVLQEKEVLPLGSSKPVSVQTRVIAATHHDLDEERLRGKFREDLYFRLNVFTLHIPALRDRQGDIPLLANTFIQSFNQRYKKSIRPLRADTCAKLEAYDWPGNVRELQNSIERAIVLAERDEINIEDIFRPKGSRRSPNSAELDDQSLPLIYAEAKENFEKSFLLRIMKAARGSVSTAARISGRYRSDIYRLMERYGVEAEEFKP